MDGQVVPRNYTLEQILTENQVYHIVQQSIGKDVPWVLVGCEVKPAMDGISGFLGDHIRATLSLRVGEDLKKIHLFIKHVPLLNKPKAELIDKYNFFKREMFLYKMLEEICPENEPNPWCTRALLYTDKIILMPDLAADGYAPRHFLETLDMPHLLLTAASIARFHAAFTNYETKKPIDEKRPYSTYQEHTGLFTEPNQGNLQWVRACSKLTDKFLEAFSNKNCQTIPNLESKLTKLYSEARDSFKEEKDTLNVIIHKDLWVNNIMFKYKDNTPSNALLLDYQCLSYGPPAFDVMIFLYLTTTREFREDHETQILQHYYRTFTEHLDKSSERRLQKLGYNEEVFSSWCERSRMFALFVAISIFPLALMEPKIAEKTFDNPDTYDKYINEDRSEPVLSHARTCSRYRDRQLEVSEEFIERYLLHSSRRNY